MAKSRQTKKGENLAETLANGNFTENGQKIVSKNGGGYLDLRFLNLNDAVSIGNSLGARVFLVPNSSSLSFGSNVFNCNNDNVSALFQRTSDENYCILGVQGMSAGDIVNYSAPSGIVIVSNNIQDKDFSTDAIEIASIVSGSGVSVSTGKQNVRNSVLVGGVGLTAKTSNTAYFNQISFQASGNLFDVLIIPPTATADRTQTLQDKSGTIALLSDTTLNNYVEKWTPYNATINATWETIVIADAIANSLIEVVCVGNSVVINDMGIRSVGSALNRFVSPTGSSSVTMTVKTDSLKQIQIYASDFNQIDFFFSAQL